MSNLQENNSTNDLQTDKALFESFAGKVNYASTDHMEKLDSHLPNDYFDTFPSVVLEKINHQNKSWISRILPYQKYAIAASLIIIIGSAYFFIPNNNWMHAASKVKLNEIITEDIESYVTNNELISEAELQVELLNNETTLVSSGTSKYSTKDTTK
jgi:hypothetical protein